MPKIEGVSILFAVNDRVKPIEKDGFVGRFTPPDKIAVEVRVSGLRIYAISVDGKKKIALKKNHTPAEEYATYRFEMQVKLTNDGRNHVEYPENNMRLVRVLSGKVEIWQITVIAQNNSFFLITEKSYDIYVKNNIVYYPHSFRKRPQYVAFLNEILSNPIVKYQPESTAEGLKKDEGRVLWWNSAQGFGAIITQEGVLRVYWEEVAKRPRLAYLIPGEIVKYQGVKLPVQPPDTLRKTSFQKEAMGVKPVHCANILALVKP